MLPSKTKSPFLEMGDNEVVAINRSLNFSVNSELRFGFTINAVFEKLEMLTVLISGDIDAPVKE